MNRKTPHLKNALFNPIRIIIPAAFIIIQAASCNNADPDISQNKKPAAPDNWIVLNVTFRANTTTGIRDTCLMRIKNMLIDSAKALSTAYPDYYPAVSMESYPFGDTLAYMFKIGKASFLKKGGPTGIKFPRDTSTNFPISCTCANGCKICESVPQLYYFPGRKQTNLSVYIASVTTE